MRYFSVLENTGNISNTTTYNMMIYMFIVELLTGPLRNYVTTEDYIIILNVIDSLTDGRIIPYESTLGNSIEGVWPEVSLTTTSGEDTSLLLNTDNSFQLNIIS